MNAMRGLLRQLLFCVPPKGPGPEKQDKPERLRPVPTTMPEETLEQSPLKLLQYVYTAAVKGHQGPFANLGGKYTEEGDSLKKLKFVSSTVWLIVSSLF